MSESDGMVALRWCGDCRDYHATGEDCPWKDYQPWHCIDCGKVVRGNHIHDGMTGEVLSEGKPYDAAIQKAAP